MIRKTLLKFDLFANDVKPATIQGFIVTMKVIIGTVVYSTILFIMQINKPPIKEIGTEWTLGAGPFPINITCLAPSGCIILNDVSYHNTLGMSNLVPNEEQKCFNITEGISVILHIIYTMNIYEGIKIAWKGNQSITIQSEIRCANTLAKGCVNYLNLPILPGLTSLNYVETHNSTEIFPANFRREWFMNIVSEKNISNTKCHLDNTWNVAQIQLTSLYNTVNVINRITYIEFISILGGAFSIFTTFGGFLLIIYNFICKHIVKRKTEKCNIQQSKISILLENIEKHKHSVITDNRTY